MGSTKTSINGWLYCFIRDDKAVFLNRKDELIKEFDTMNEAIEFANKNINMIEVNKYEL